MTWAYLLWWLGPIAVAIRASFSTTDAYLPQGFTTDWYHQVLGDPVLRTVFLRSVRLAALTVLVATPLGAAMALGLDRWRSRASRVMTGAVVLAVATPQIAIGVALFLVFAFVFPTVGLDVRAQFLAHVTLAIPFVVVVLRVRLLQIGRQYEEMAMDLGATPAESIRRILLPLAAPALVAAGAVAFTLSFDNLVLSNAVCLRVESCGTVPMVMFEAVVRAAATPDIYALAVMALLVSLTAFAVVLGTLRLMRLLR
ncbi:MAG: ABC transporter permease subunit [Actinomycetota bacterium]|nr:ABC transporter permease subunit [Actinomycetota bacterium]